MLIVLLVPRVNGFWYFGQVEAYRPNDSACHGRFGITARTAPVVRYFCYHLKCHLLCSLSTSIMCPNVAWCDNNKVEICLLRY